MSSEASAAAIIASIQGDKGQRAAAYAQLEALAGSSVFLGGGTASSGQEREAIVDVAAQCIGPLLETVIAADVSSVDAAEFQRAHLVLAELFALEPLRLMAEWTRNVRGGISWGTPGNAWAAVFEKEPSDLSRADVLTVAAGATPLACTMSRGSDATNDAGGIDSMQWVAEFVGEVRGGRPGGNRLMVTHAHPPPDAFMDRLCLLAFETIRDPRELSELELAGLWAVLWMGVGGRAPLAMTLIEAGMVDAAVATLQKHSPTEWITWCTPTGTLASSICTLGWTLSTIAGIPHKTQLLLDRGFIEVTISVMKAYELCGANKVHQATPCGIWCMVQMLAVLDLTAPEAKPIVRMLEGIPSALRFMLENPLDHVKGVGMSTNGACPAVCAMAFGKEEGGNFAFDQAMIDGVIQDILVNFSGVKSGFLQQLPPFFLRPVVYLCVSDVNKKLLVQCPDLLTLLTEGLLVDPQHERQTQDDSIKAAIQQDAAECFLQLALFEPGRAMMAKEGGVMEALGALVSGQALTEMARQYASGVMIAVDEQIDEVLHAESTESESGGHLMVSYQWDVQKTIERVVRSLQARGYDVWFDVDRMKGSAIEAMAEAVDGAEVVLFGVSLAYKESANCRLEANYAHQSRKDMLPLMMEKGYNPDGWLGLLLGTRIYYRFFDAEHDDQASFEKRVDAVTREIGDRGQPKGKAWSVSEAIPPARGSTVATKPKPKVPITTNPAPVPARVSALAPAPAPAPAPARTSLVETSTTPRPAATTDQPFTPTMQQPTLALSSPAEISALFKEMRQDANEIRRSVIAERDELEAKMEQRLRQQRAELTEQQELVSAQQLDELQVRLERLHSAQLLADEELWALEDLYADFLEMRTAAGGVLTQQVAHSSPGCAAAKFAKLVGVSEGLASDAAFARQARRKFV